MICVFLIQGSYTLGVGYSYCGRTFGIRNLSQIQGTISTITGLISLLLDAYWNFYIIDVLKSQRLASLLVTILGAFLYVFPVVLLVAKWRIERANKDSGEIHL